MKILDIPANIIPSLDNIFASVILGGIDRHNKDNTELLLRKIEVAKVAKSRLVSDFQFNIFNDIYAIFYDIIVKQGIKTFDKNQLESILENNRDLILDSPYISIDRFAGAQNGNIANSDEIFEAMKLDIIEVFDKLSYMPVTEEEFNSACTIYIDWFRNAYLASITQDMAIIMQEQGLDIKLTNRRKRHYQGRHDCMEYYSEALQVLNSLEDEKKIVSTICDAQWYQAEMQNEKDTDDKALFDIGIREITAVQGKLRRGNMLGILGAPKGGKTRMTNFVVNRALRLGYNVCVWPLEGTQEEWVSMQVAALLAADSYDAFKQGRSEQMILIDSKDILEKRYMRDKNMSSIVAAAKQKLAIGEKMGRLSFIEGTAYIEDFTEVLMNHYREVNPFDVVVIDPLINIMSKSSGGSKSERISEAYIRMKDFVANKLKVPALAVIPCQLKQSVVDFLRSHPEETIDVTAGGESSETIRTPDYSLGLFSTKEERSSNIMKFYDVASRHNASFDDFTARCYLGSCFFLSEQDDISR